MTISEVQACKARGMDAPELIAHVTAAHMAQLRADELAIRRVYAPHATCLFESKLVAYDYNGR